MRREGVYEPNTAALMRTSARGVCRVVSGSRCDGCGIADGVDASGGRKEGREEGRDPTVAQPVPEDERDQ